MRPFLLFIFLLNTLIGLAQDSWELKKDRNNIKVYTRDYPDSKFKEYRAEMTLNTSLETVKDIILNSDGLKDWNYKTSESRLLEKIDDDHYTIYLYNDMPWPVLNRDHISDIVVSYPKVTSILITIRPNNNIMSPTDGVVRITNFKGHWLLEETAKGIFIRHQLFGDPEGGVPSWLVNSQLIKSPYTSFINLKVMLENKTN